MAIGAPQHHDTDLAITLDSAQSLGEFFRHPRAEGVSAIRSIERDLNDAVLLCKCDPAEFHGNPFLLGLREG